jgi:hypothetical protein
MRSIRAGWLVVWLLACATACSSPTAPEPVPAGYAGEWVGTTGQGTPVSFSVSGDQVMSFTLSFNFSPTCSGTETRSSCRTPQGDLLTINRGSAWVSWVRIASGG